MDKTIIYESEYAKNEFAQSINENLCIIMIRTKDTYKDLLTHLLTLGGRKATSTYLTYVLGISAKIEFVAKKYEHHPLCGYKSAKYSEEYPANKFYLLYGNGGKREKIPSASSLKRH